MCINEMKIVKCSKREHRANFSTKQRVKFLSSYKNKQKSIKSKQNSCVFSRIDNDEETDATSFNRKEKINSWKKIFELV